jgi:S1-C subfamily serine protease
MTRRILPAFLIVPVVIGGAQALAQLTPELILKGKRATALVEVDLEKGTGSGSAFCVDESGLFVTNAHVVDRAADKEAPVRLVLGIGSEDRRSLPARVLRRDDRLDLALLEVEKGPGTAVLDLGRDGDLKLLARVFTFGYPLGKDAAVEGAEFPDITILPSQITALRREKGELVAIQFNNQVNPGNSGGPVLDESGRVVGVAVATMRGQARNLAIPVGRLDAFLRAPGLVFEPPEFNYAERSRPVKWPIRLRPPNPRARLAEGLSVVVTLSRGDGPRQTYTAEPLGDGAFEATVTAVPRNPDWPCEARISPASQGLGFDSMTLKIPDADAQGGRMRFMLAVLKTLRKGRPLRAPEDPKEAADRPRVGLATVMIKRGTMTETRDLNRVEQIHVQANHRPREHPIKAVVEAREGPKVLATVYWSTVLAAPPGIDLDPMSNPGVSIVPRPSATPGLDPDLNDAGLLTLGGAIDVDGIPCGAAARLRPPRVAIPAARLTPDLAPADPTSLERRLDGTISDVTVGGGGRYLLLTLKDAGKLAVLDVEAADIVKTIKLPSPHVLVAAGTAKFLLVFPDEKLLQRWDLATLKREGNNRLSPIDGRINDLAMGCDSGGPALAAWSKESPTHVPSVIRFSFIDLDSLSVLRVGLAASTQFAGLTTSGGSIRRSWVMTGPVRLRASAGGAHFGLGPHMQTLTVLGRAILEASNYGHNDTYLAPGPDGRTVFGGKTGRLNPDLEPAPAAGTPGTAPAVTMPSSHPGYYLGIDGLPDAVTELASSKNDLDRPVTASVHSTADGSRLLTVHGLDEMAYAMTPGDALKVQAEQSQTRFTLDKRFFLIPQAHLLITIPWTNDRVVLRRLDLDAALDQAGGTDLVVTSAPTLAVRAGEKLEHQIATRSRRQGIGYTLIGGPERLSVAPDGKLSWDVPAALQGDEVTVLVRVRDGAGRELTHELHILVR